MRKAAATEENFTQKKRWAAPLRTVLVLVLLAALVAGCVVLAKYVRQRDYEGNAISALDNYFTIDLLGDTNEEEDLSAEVDLYGGGEQSVSFAVQNFFDTLRISQSSITYTISVSATQPADDSGEDPVEYTAAYTLSRLAAGAEDTADPEDITDDAKAGRASFTIPSDETTDEAAAAASDQFTLSVESGYTNGSRIVITVSQTVPYTKQMTLTFILHADAAPVSYRIDGGYEYPYATLVITANVTVKAEELYIDWEEVNQTGNHLQIDTTNPYILDETEGNLPVLSTNNPSESQYGNTPDPYGDSSLCYLVHATNSCDIAAGECISIKFMKTGEAYGQNFGTNEEVAVEKEDGRYFIKIEAQGSTMPSAEEP